MDFNVIGGGMSGVSPNDPVTMSFNVDSNTFTNSGSFPVRGYNVLLPSFAMTVGGVAVPIRDPQPSTAYFVLRNNDPAVDGFYFARGGVDFPAPWAVNIPGLTPTHDLDFLATYNGTTVLSSLDILDAVGTYDLNGISVYGWTIGRFGTAGAEYAYQSMTISAVPEPGTLAALGAGLAVLLRRRRR